MRYFFQNPECNISSVYSIFIDVPLLKFLALEGEKTYEQSMRRPRKFLSRNGGGGGGGAGPNQLTSFKLMRGERIQ